MDLEKVNAVGRLDGFLPTKPLSELDSNGRYVVTKMKKVQTKYGPRIIVELDANFVTYLPSRLAKHFDEEGSNSLKLMQEAVSTKNLQLQYLGGPYNNVQFKLLK
ncbi:uncharacterized protein LOC122499599 [Leptopilina heterotoma]|uniref:uncharacterized protein LOC122499599 n=1 Tax=Leptopilina heterotoma TaxID=63436 RepID=UPI001CA98628|nr:uncharacterized protein LOC122499599 [Leptopilina heterotoma]